MFKSSKNLLKMPKTKLPKRDLFSKSLVITVTTFVLLILLILVIFIVYKSLPVFKNTSFFGFIFGGKWDPSGGSYGIGGIILSTITMLVISLMIAVPLTIFGAVYINEYLNAKVKKIVITCIQLLAGIPSVVFGLFALDQIGSIFVLMGAPTQSNMMTASVTLAFMALPTMLTLSINAVAAVPESYRFAALGLGMTKERTTFGVVIKAATPKIIAAVIAGMARVIGETMAVILIAGNSTAGLNTNGGFFDFIFSSIRTLAGTIGLEMLENHGPEHESSLYAIGLILFIIVIIINLAILTISNYGARKERRIQRAQKLKNSKIKTKSKELEHLEFEDYKLTVYVKTHADKRFKKTMHSFFAKFFMITSTAIIVSFTAWIILTVIIKGIAGFNVNELITIEGQRSGIFATLLTTLLLVASTLILAIPLALFVAVYLTEYSNPKSIFVKVIRFCINVLASTPSIVFGVFGLTIFVIYMGLPMSIFASSLTLTIVILPMMIASFEDAITSVPLSYREAAYGMGMSKTGVTFKVVIPNAMQGILTGIILGMARIIGESAPVYLTLGTSVRMPSEGFMSSGATLTTEIYMLASEGANSGAMNTAYMMALITVLLVLFLNWLNKYISKIIDPGFKRLGFKKFWITKYNGIIKHDYVGDFKHFGKFVSIKSKKFINLFNVKKNSIYLKNSKVRKKVLNDIVKEAKENGRKANNTRTR